MALFWPQGPPRDSDQHALHSFLPGSPALCPLCWLVGLIFGVARRISGPLAEKVDYSPFLLCS